VGNYIGLYFPWYPIPIQYWAFQSDIGSFRYQTELWYHISDWLIQFKFSRYELTRYPIFRIIERYTTIWTLTNNVPRGIRQITTKICKFLKKILNITKNVSPISECADRWPSAQLCLLRYLENRVSPHIQCEGQIRNKIK
jgi:hypothetical protein